MGADDEDNRALRVGTGNEGVHRRGHEAHAGSCASTRRARRKNIWGESFFFLDQTARSSGGILRLGRAEADHSPFGNSRTYPLQKTWDKSGKQFAFRHKILEGNLSKKRRRNIFTKSFLDLYGKILNLSNFPHRISLLSTPLYIQTHESCTCPHQAIWSISFLIDRWSSPWTSTPSASLCWPCSLHTSYPLPPSHTVCIICNILIFFSKSFLYDATLSSKLKKLGRIYTHRFIFAVLASLTLVQQVNYIMYV